MDDDDRIPAGWFEVEFWDDTVDSETPAVYSGDSVKAYFYDLKTYCENLAKCGIATRCYEIE